MRHTIALLILSAAIAFGQGQAVNQVSGTPPNNWVQYLDTGSAPQYVCQAQALQPTPTVFYVSSSTLTSIAVSTNVGTITFSSTSYLWIGARITVAGSATTALNGTYSVTGVSGSTATIATSGVSNGTYNDATLSVSTNAPLLNQLVWAIQVIQTSGPVYWAGAPSSVPPMGLACSSRHNY